MDSLELAPRRPEGCPGDLTLLRYAQEELPAQARAQLQPHLTQCPRCSARLEALLADKPRFQAEVPFDAFYADLSPRLAAAAPLPARPLTAQVGEPAAPGWLEVLWSAVRRELSLWRGPQLVAVGASLLALLVLVPTVLRPSEQGFAYRAGVVAPGSLEIYLLRAGQVTVAQDGDAFRAGDRLQILVRPGTYRYLHLFTLDAQGRRTPLYPPDDGASIVLGPDAEQLLPGAIQLDDYQGLERIYAVFSLRPLPGRQMDEAVSRAVRAHGLPLPLDTLVSLETQGTAQVSFLMVKP